MLGFVEMPCANEVVEEWQPSQAPLCGWFASCAVVGRVTIVTPYQLIPFSWQLAQPLLMPVWLMVVPEKLVNFEAEWQLSQARPEIGR